MVFEICGFEKGQDELSFQQDIPHSREEIKAIMGWKEEWEYHDVCDLTEQQVLEIQKLCPFELPVNLDLQLSCHA